MIPVPGKFGCCSILVILLGSACPSVVGKQLDLSKAPLELAIGRDARVFMTLDDSGSMRAAWMPEGMEAHVDLFSGVCGFQTPGFFSKHLNSIAYDPATVYVPPLKSDGSRFPAANFNAAWLDGIRANSGGYATTVNLGTQYFPTFELWDNGTQFTHRTIRHVAVPVGAPDCNAPTDAQLTARLPFVSGTGPGMQSAAFWFDFTGTGVGAGNDPWLETNYTARAVPVDQRQNFANWYSYFRNRSLLARSAISSAFAQLKTPIRIAWQNLEANPIVAATAMSDFAGTARQAFFDWLYFSPTSGSTPLRAATLRVGEFFRRSGAAPANPYWEPALGIEVSCPVNAHLLVTDGYWNEKNPPVDPTGSGIQSTLAMPDGLYTYVPGTGPDTTVYWNQTPRGTLAQENCRNAANATVLCDPTLADLAMHYWASDLRPDLENNVPPRWVDLATGITSTAAAPSNATLAASVPEVYWNPANDPATWQHLNQYVVAMGVGSMLPFNQNSYMQLRKGLSKWPYPKNASSRAVDDAWRASLASRGDFLLAKNGQELETKLATILNSIDLRRGSASALSVSSGVASTSALAVGTGYDTGDWTGRIEAFALDEQGVPATQPTWEAGAKLSLRLPDSRVIFTSSTSDGSGVAFRWAGIGAAWQSALDDDPATPALDDDGFGADRLSYLRGDRSREARQGGPFRNRASLLGAVVHSGAAVVAAPASGIREDRMPADAPEAIAAASPGGQSYDDFREVHRQRRRVVYVGANDGMLHAIDAGQGSDPGTGEELWAYVPHELAGHIGRLTMPGRGFEPMVDSTPVVRDVFIDGEWRTLLVGNLRRGGQGIYALDITSPVLTENNASDLVLWEFSDDSNGAERLGYTYGKPNIARLPHGRWVVLLPGGYNNEESDAAVGTGAASLFVIDAQSGSLVREMQLPDGYGLGFLTLGDSNDDEMEDFGVAGDLVGNLWRFDFTAANAAQWTVEKLFEPEPLDREKYPITSSPRIFAAATAGQGIVIVGTGKFLEPLDRAPGGVSQRLMAVRDLGPGAAEYPWHLDDLAEHTLSRVPAPVASTEPRAHFEIDDLSAEDTASGWYFNFAEPGERLVAGIGALFSQGLFYAATIIPNGADPCKGGLGGNFYLLDAATGNGTGEQPLFDSNNDGTVDAADSITAVGIELEQGVVEGVPPVVVSIGGGDAAVAGLEGIRVPEPLWRRRMWRELR